MDWASSEVKGLLPMEKHQLTVARAWLLTTTRPLTLMQRLSANDRTIFLGLWSVLLRFGITTITTGLLLVLLKRIPFAPSYLPFIPIEDYYKAELVFLPLWGVAIWLLMGIVAYGIARIAGSRPALGGLLTIIGLGMLAPMAVLWIWDWAMISLNLHRAVIQAVAHSLAQTWEGLVEAVGFKTVLRLKIGTAVAMAVVINIVYVTLAALLIR